MILSVSRRTDIPAAYPEWFINRVRAGHVLLRNPINNRLSRLPLSPGVVDCIVFWSKDPAPLLPYLGELDERGFSYYFQFTLTPYGKEIEPGLRGKAEIAATFQSLSRRLGKNRVVWRYDPILLAQGWDVPRHKEAFARLCGDLAGYTDSVVISFLQPYTKLAGRYAAPPKAEKEELARFIGAAAKAHGLQAFACSQEEDWRAFGIAPSACIDKARIEQVCGASLLLSPDKNQRPACGCYESRDIGVYNTCPNGCLYCYANANAAAANARHAAHNPLGELLFGQPKPGEGILEIKAESNKTAQLSFGEG